MTSRLENRQIRLATIVVVGAMFAFLAVLEVGTRIWLGHFANVDQIRLYEQTDESEFVFAPHPYLSYRLRPGYKICEGEEKERVCTHINSLGYRGAEFKRTKEEGMVRIVAMGGSTTFTSAVLDDNKSYPRQLQQILRQAYGREDVEVINAGVSDYNSWELVGNLAFRVLDPDPDYIILYCGANDGELRNLIDPKEFVSDNLGGRMNWTSPERPLVEKSLLYRILATRLRMRRPLNIEDLVIPYGADDEDFYEDVDEEDEENYEEEEDLKKRLEENSAVFFRRNLRTFIAIAKENGVEVLLVSFGLNDAEWYQPTVNEHNERLGNLAAEKNLPFFDFDKYMPRDEEYWSDLMHLTAKGAQLKAELIAQFIIENNILR